VFAIERGFDADTELALASSGGRERLASDAVEFVRGVGDRSLDGDAIDHSAADEVHRIRERRLEFVGAFADGDDGTVRDDESNADAEADTGERDAPRRENDRHSECRADGDESAGDDRSPAPVRHVRVVRSDAGGRKGDRAVGEQPAAGTAQSEWQQQVVNHDYGGYRGFESGRTSGGQYTDECERQEDAEGVQRRRRPAERVGGVGRPLPRSVEGGVHRPVERPRALTLGRVGSGVDERHRPVERRERITPHRSERSKPRLWRPARSSNVLFEVVAEAAVGFGGEGRGAFDRWRDANPQYCTADERRCRAECATSTGTPDRSNGRSASGGRSDSDTDCDDEQRRRHRNGGEDGDH
jgi:hypothetical protein